MAGRKPAITVIPGHRQCPPPALGQHHGNGSAPQETDSRTTGNRPFVVLAWTSDKPDGDLPVPGPTAGQRGQPDSTGGEHLFGSCGIPWCGGAYPLADVGGPVAADAACPVDGGLDVDAEQAGQYRVIMIAGCAARKVVCPVWLAAGSW